MEKIYLFDVDSLLQVLQAIKEGRPVEYRPLEEPNWRDFNPEEYDIDTKKTACIVSSLVSIVNTWEVLLYLLRLCRKM